MIKVYRNHLIVLGGGKNGEPDRGSVRKRKSGRAGKEERGAREKQKLRAEKCGRLEQEKRKDEEGVCGKEKGGPRR